MTTVDINDKLNENKTPLFQVSARAILRTHHLYQHQTAHYDLAQDHIKIYVGFAVPVTMHS